MEDIIYTAPDDVKDSLIHAKPSTIPLIEKDLIHFIENNLSDKFPDIKTSDRDALLIHQGKLELLAELKLVRTMQGVNDED